MNIPMALIERLRSADRVVVLTGAGISAESGVPTFRDAQTGLWSKYRPDELATPTAFRKNPGLVWEWYQWRRELVSEAIPNLAHTSLVIIEEKVKDFTLITQNIDGLHQMAGNQNILELHGNIQRYRCVDENIPVVEIITGSQIPPRCPNCGGYIRPDVVWFGESLDEEILHAAWEAAKKCDLFFSIGTSSLVQPAASLPYLAIENQAMVVEINLTDTPISAAVTYSIKGSAASILPEIVKIAWSEGAKGKQYNHSHN